jgi:hypothetical protein
MARLRVEQRPSESDGSPVPGLGLIGWLWIGRGHRTSKHLAPVKRRGLPPTNLPQASGTVVDKIDFVPPPPQTLGQVRARH